jgi:hypothetical protein
MQLSPFTKPRAGRPGREGMNQPNDSHPGRSVDYTARYSELDVLRSLPSGTVVDGELVVLNQGRADLPTPDSARVPVTAG